MMKGELMRIDDAIEKADISKPTFQKLVRLGHVKRYTIGGRGFVHYRDLLRGAWEFEQTKNRGGRPKMVKETK